MAVSQKYFKVKIAIKTATRAAIYYESRTSTGSFEYKGVRKNNHKVEKV